jgi:phosphatidylethanolamine/phosphatidyl-N-methylethanolamine N-methyltransferase
LTTQSDSLRPRTYRGIFLSEMLRRPGRTAAVMPSSRALARMMTHEIGAQSGGVVELGGGTGKITEAILARGIAPACLAIYETNPVFAGILRRRFPGVQVIESDARTVAGAPLADIVAVISGLPLLSIPTRIQHQIVAGAFNCMRPGGIFVQFTYHGWRPPVDREVREALGLTWTASPWVLGNLPPARVYTFRKAG